MSKRKKKQPMVNLNVLAVLIFLSVFTGFWLSEQLSAKRYAAVESEPETVIQQTETPKEVTEPEPTAQEMKEPDQVEAEEPEEAKEELPAEEPEADALDNTAIGWSFKRNTDHTPVIGYNQGIDLEKYDAFYINNKTDEKVVYLTFDLGYENGYTPMILDSLKRNGVKAAFFILDDVVKTNPELCIRMKEEGHVVGNHSNTHPSLPTLTDEELQWELTSTADIFKEATGYEMDKFLRPPRAEFSERTLYLTRLNGYRSVFYSMAYKDWLVDDQPGADAAYQHVMDNVHPGAVILLHAVSQSNAEAMDRILSSLHEQGYRFGSLYEIPSIY